MFAFAVRRAGGLKAGESPAFATNGFGAGVLILRAGSEHVLRRGANSAGTN